MSNTNEINLNQYLSFYLNDEKYAVSVLAVNEVAYIKNITRVPRMPDFMKGITNLRGSVLPVIDLALKLRLPSRPIAPGEEVKTITLDIKHEGRKIELGAIVDSVDAVLEIMPSQIENEVKLGSNISPEYIYGLANISNEFLLILNIDRIFSLEEIRQVTLEHQNNVDIKQLKGKLLSKPQSI